MDSLFANYASSDEDDEQQLPPSKQLNPPVQLEQGFNSKSNSERGGILTSLPPPKSSLFNSLPPPKSHFPPNPSPQPQFGQQREESDEHGEEILENPKPKSSSSLFSSLPTPKLTSTSSSASKPKRVVQFKPPTMVNPYPSSVNDDEDEDDEGEKERQRKKLKESVSTSSATSFLSSIPAPRYSSTLGGLGMGRKSMLEVAPASTGSVVTATKNDVLTQPNGGFVGEQFRETSYDHSSHGLGGESNAYYGGYADGAGFVNASGVSAEGNDVGVNSGGTSEVWSAEMNNDYSSRGSVSEIYAHSDGYSASYGVNVGSGAVDYSYGNVEHVEYTNPGDNYAEYGNSTQYENNWSNVPEVSEVVREMKAPGRRGRKNDIPQIVEVKQDELIKNRPREDQVKMTGIAFGPAYQPTSSKGKPTKLHKRKHQIGSLYFDMRQKEMELAERRSQGFQTKAQTQAKYGW